MHLRFPSGIFGEPHATTVASSLPHTPRPPPDALLQGLQAASVWNGGTVATGRPVVTLVDKANVVLLGAAETCVVIQEDIDERAAGSHGLDHLLPVLESSVWVHWERVGNLLAALQYTSWKRRCSNTLFLCHTAS